jgi:hypothetical protein
MRRRTFPLKFHRKPGSLGGAPEFGEEPVARGFNYPPILVRDTGFHHVAEHRGQPGMGACLVLGHMTGVRHDIGHENRGQPRHWPHARSAMDQAQG